MFHYGRVLTILAFVAMSWPPAALAKGNDVEFHGTVLRVSMESPTQGVLTLRLMGFSVAVKLTGETEIETHGDEGGFDDLSIGDFVKVSGFFTNSTIVAKEIEIVDRGDGEFRLRGPISAVRVSSDGTIITVLGIDVLVNSETKIERRGPSGGFTASNLEAGMLVDTRGDSIEARFVARRVKVGMREDDAIRVEVAGRITTVATDRLAIDTEGGSTAVVLITTGTTVLGTPAVGRFAEVRGTLNSNLEVVASRIIVKTSRDSDDHISARAPVEFEREISLSPVASGATIRGEAEIEIEVEDGRQQQEFKLEVSHAQPNTEYRIMVDVASSGQVDFGTFRTNSEGSAEVKFTTSPREPQRDLRSLLPAGKTVRDFVSVRVLLGNTVVLQGTF